MGSLRGYTNSTTDYTERTEETRKEARDKGRKICAPTADPELQYNRVMPPNFCDPHPTTGTMKSLLRLVTVLSCLSTSTIGQAIYPYYVPPRDRFTRINIEQLHLGDHAFPESARIQRLYDEYTRKKATDFISQPDPEHSCKSQLQPGYTCRELPDTQVGYLEYLKAGQYFRRLDPDSREVQVFHHVEKNQFYVRASRRQDRVFGPFKGDPIAALKRATVQAKKRYSFPGVTLEYLSKRWEFPDEKDAMLDRSSPDYDFVGGRISGRQIEAARLLSQFFRFRVENRSGKQLYLLYLSDVPETFELMRGRSDEAWRRQKHSSVDPLSGYRVESLNWVSLPDRSAIEFETKAGCALEWICAVGVYLNDEQNLLNEVQLIASYPSNRERRFSPKYAPPPLR